jgi:hypothetical protein
VKWKLVLDTVYTHGQTPATVCEHLSIYPLQPRSIAVFEALYAPLP